MNIIFEKWEASGNDFVVIDNREDLIEDIAAFAQRACDRHKGIGADGVILLENSDQADYKMRIINADGSEAEMCGNGARCIGAFANQRLGFADDSKMETLAGIVGVTISEDKVKVLLSNPTDFRDAFELDVDGQKFEAYFVNTGVPHAVVFVDNLSEFPVDEIGEKIRFHEAFKPAGTNVNFVERQQEDTIKIRTFERGVGETLACGTGMSAAGIMSVLNKDCLKPLNVFPKDGRLVKIDFDNESTVENVTLEGTASFVFKGTIQK